MYIYICVCVYVYIFDNGNSFLSEKTLRLLKKQLEKLKAAEKTLRFVEKPWGFPKNLKTLIS